MTSCTVGANLGDMEEQTQKPLDPEVERELELNQLRIAALEAERDRLQAQILENEAKLRLAEKEAEQQEQS